MCWHEVASGILAIAGLAFIFGVNETSNDSVVGIIFAIVAGMGYGIFLTISPRLHIGSGLLVVNSLLLFGVIYLFLPFVADGLVFINDLNTAMLMVFLALLPTIGGFLCTTKALTLLKSEAVQLIELTEPIFALLFSFVFLGQWITFWQMLGGALVIAAIYMNLIISHRYASPDKPSKQDIAKNSLQI